MDIKELLELAQDQGKSSYYRTEAIQDLAKQAHQNTEALQALLSLSQDPDQNVRLRYIKSLAEFKEDEVAERLLILLHDEMIIITSRLLSRH